MIQRIQHLYFALIALVGIWFSTTVLMEFPSAKDAIDSIEIRATGIKMYQNGTQTILSESNMLMILLLLLITNSIYIIFLYKNRNRQSRLGLLNYFIIAGFMISLFYMLSSQINFSRFSLSELKGNSILTCIFSFLILVLNYLALKGIARDEDLVRSADRIR